MQKGEFKIVKLEDVFSCAKAIRYGIIKRMMALDSAGQASLESTSLGVLMVCLGWQQGLVNKRMELAAELEGGLKIGLNDILTIELEADDDDSSYYARRWS